MEQLIASIDRLTLAVQAHSEFPGPPNLPQGLPLPPQSSRNPEPLYTVSSPSRNGTIASWAEASIETQEAAQAAFDYAVARGWTRRCMSRPPSPISASKPLSTGAPLIPWHLSDQRNPLHGHDINLHSPDNTWYVV
ncbi:hypothetical protein C8J57DRAFT_1529751 [Mycena rebaudengoi]|nr:hypothetical protein C8J57DRAFT_1529751 [Mycena rebaudengoi]